MGGIFVVELLVKKTTPVFFWYKNRIVSAILDLQFGIYTLVDGGFLV